jgi:hypothetical protein
MWVPFPAVPIVVIVVLLPAAAVPFLSPSLVDVMPPPPNVVPVVPVMMPPGPDVPVSLPVPVLAGGRRVAWTVVPDDFYMHVSGGDRRSGSQQEQTGEPRFELHGILHSHSQSRCAPSAEVAG